MAAHGIKHDTNRVRLEECIPLNTPFRLNLELSSACNFHCQFCLHGSADADRPMPIAIMETALAKKCIDDLAGFHEKIKTLSFFELGEPLLQKDIAEIIRYAHERNAADTLSITTNGALLTHSLSEQLIEAGLNHIDISIYGLSTLDYKEFCGASLDFDALVEQISYLNSLPRIGSTLVVKINEVCFHSEEDQDRFYQIFNSICDRMVIEQPVSMWYDFEIGVSSQPGIDIRGNAAKEIDVCASPFFMMSVSAGGTISLCCADWKRQLAVGNARTESLESVWNGEKANAFRLKMLRDGIKGMPSCSRCGWPRLCGIDNIDPYRTELLKRMNR